MSEAVTVTREIVAKYKGREGVLTHILQDIQGRFGYLPPEAMEVVAEEMGVSLAELYGMASFYARFYFAPRGKTVIKVCRGTACHVRGSERVLAKFSEELGLKEGETSPDLSFTLEAVNCVGCCALAPVVMINEKVFTASDPGKLLAALRQGENRDQDH
ncbi:complex I 24 kDa subunit family protein [Ammonifex thiophilus]|uniref:NAD(P)H-dependent oxidoreductase subunit E n=1 Tax=Ammonifex thiophilus TaxID=444093 RepID=A0A3D8P895_9THEO|nr:NAD(P)H-dependent oxidoreductase subunit E [Ammonifex thiophilus]RDV84858.1 NAD(P)H-dependent oxidoreductase subunit E [Ammonifex thiophilus]